MKLTIVGLRDEYVKRLSDDMYRHGVKMCVLPRVCTPGDNDRRHTVILTDDYINISVLNTPDGRVGCIIGDKFKLKLWGDSFLSMYLR